MSSLKYVLPRGPSTKRLYVDSDIHQAVIYYALKRGITIQQATRELLDTAIRQYFGLDAPGKGKN